MLFPDDIIVHHFISVASELHFRNDTSVRHLVIAVKRHGIHTNIMTASHRFACFLPKQLNVKRTNRYLNTLQDRLKNDEIKLGPESFSLSPFGGLKLRVSKRQKMIHLLFVENCVSKLIFFSSFVKYVLRHHKMFF